MSKAKKEFYAGIRHPVGQLTINLYTEENLIKNVKYYATTFLGEKYVIYPEKLLESKKEDGLKCYKMTIKRPKLFCKYIIKWEWA